MSREDATLCRDNNISGGPNNSNVPSQNIALDLYLLEEHSDSKSLLLRQLTSYLKKENNIHFAYNVTTTLRGGRGTRDNAECENAHLLRWLGRKPNFDLTNVTYTALVATLLIYRMCSFAIVQDGTRKVVGWHAVPAYFDVFGGSWGIWPVTNTNLNKIMYLSIAFETYGETSNALKTAQDALKLWRCKWLSISLIASRNVNLLRVERYI